MTCQRTNSVAQICLLALGAFVLLSFIPARAQSTPSSTSSQSFAPGSDPQAISFAEQSIAALSGKEAIQDVTLTGSVTWNAGENETGTIVLRALGSTESRIDLALSGGTRSEIRDASAGYAQGKWINPNGTSGMFASHNTMTDAVWFFPIFSSLVAQSNVVLSYVGLENRNGELVQHLRSCIYQSSNDPSPLVQQLTTTDFYLDAGSSLPVAVTFNQHPDNNAQLNIPVEIEFSNYQSISGALIPTHIQKSANGTTMLDIAVTGAVFNSGLTLSEFSVN